MLGDRRCPRDGRAEWTPSRSRRRHAARTLQALVTPRRLAPSSATPRGDPPRHPSARSSQELRALNQRARAFVLEQLPAPRRSNGWPGFTPPSTPRSSHGFWRLTGRPDRRMLVFGGVVGQRGVADPARAAPCSSSIEDERAGRGPCATYGTCSTALSECGYLPRRAAVRDGVLRAAGRRVAGAAIAGGCAIPSCSRRTARGRSSTCVQSSGGTSLWDAARPRSPRSWTATSCTCSRTTAWRTCRR